MVVAAILAGGDARRFGGRDKSQALVGGRTILSRQVDAVRPCVDRVLLVGHRGPAPHQSGIDLVPDRVAQQGPLGGLDAALAAAGGAAVLLLACDLPYITTPFVAHLIGQLDGVDAVIPRTERGYHPLCGVYAPSCRPAVARRLDAGLLRMRDLLADLRVHTLEAAEMARIGDVGHLLANVNTQADLDALDSLNH